MHWQRDLDKLPIQSFKVIIIGAGFSGLCAAIRLKELKMPSVDAGKEPRRRRDLAGKRLSRLRGRHAKSFLFVFFQPQR